MFGILASITIFVGSLSSTMVLDEHDRLAAESRRAPVVEVFGEPEAHAPIQRPHLGAQNGS